MEELKLFLEQNPHLKSYQIRLEKEMNSVSEKQRLAVLAKHIMHNLQELGIELELLNFKLSELGNKNESNT